MEFKILDVVYQKTSGSLNNVITSVNYQFEDSGSGTGADSGSTYYGYYANSVELFPVSSGSFKAYDTVTEANVKTWTANAFISHSSGEGAYTASLWNEHTASCAKHVSDSIAQQVDPPILSGRPW